MPNQPTVVPLDAVRAANPKWFAPDTMRWFRSIVAGHGYLDRHGIAIYFVSSERDIYATKDVRRYTVRVWKGEGYGIDTVGEFCGYASRSGAHAAAKREALR